MNFKQLLLPLIVAFILIIAQASVWSYKTSGVLDQTTLWTGYPWGFKYTLKDTPFGDWPINKENLYYIRQHLAFLGNLNAHVDKGAGFECHRALYSFLAKGLWFLGPILSGIILNICFWMLAVISAIATVRCFTNNRFALWSAMLLAASGQGFVYSVGEISPHVMGYASGFIILALACQAQIWRRDSPFSQHILVYLIVGLLQLSYNNPWLMLPVLWCLSLMYEWRQLQLKHTPIKIRALIKPISRLALLTTTAALPSLILIIATMPVEGVSVIQFLWKLASSPATPVHFLPLLKSYIFTTFDGLVALGPIFLGLFTLIGIIVLRERSPELVFALLLFSFQIMFCGIFMKSVSGRGYVTFGVSALLLCSGAYCLGLLWESKNRFAQAVAMAFPLGSIIYANLPLLGYRLPSLAFFEGFHKFLTNGQWQAYAIKIFS